MCTDPKMEELLDVMTQNDAEMQRLHEVNEALLAALIESRGAVSMLAVEEARKNLRLRKAREYSLVTRKWIEALERTDAAIKLAEGNTP